MSQKINLSDLAKELAEESGLSEKVCMHYANILFAKLREHLEAGDEITVKDFGKFEMRVSAPRRARDINSDSVKEIPARQKIKFIMSRKLALLYNNESEG